MQEMQIQAVRSGKTNFCKKFCKKFVKSSHSELNMLWFCIILYETQKSLYSAFKVSRPYSKKNRLEKHVGDGWFFLTQSLKS